MNTTDDGQPVGEDVPVGFQIFGTDHLRGNVVEKILGAADEARDLLDRQTQALKEIRETVGHLLGYPRHHQGVRQAARTLADILERNGLA